MTSPSTLERRFDNLWECLHPNVDLDTEVKLIPKRRFRFDYAHLTSKVAVEINGGIWGISGHSSGTGLQRDYEKINLAQSLGYAVFQLSSDMIDEHWLNLIAKTISDRQRHLNEVKKSSRAIA